MISISRISHISVSRRCCVLAIAMLLLASSAHAAWIRASLRKGIPSAQESLDSKKTRVVSILVRNRLRFAVLCWSLCQPAGKDFTAGLQILPVNRSHEIPRKVR